MKITLDTIISSKVKHGFVDVEATRSYDSKFDVNVHQFALLTDKQLLKISIENRLKVIVAEKYELERKIADIEDLLHFAKTIVEMDKVLFHKKGYEDRLGGYNGLTRIITLKE